MSNSTSQHREHSSRSLIRRVQRNDRQAWERLTALYGPVVYEWARQNGLQPQDASDVMQDVFASLMRSIGAYTPDGSFRGWLWRVTRNKVLDFHRRKSARELAAGGTAAHDRLLQWPETPPLSESEVGQHEASGVYRRALELMKTDFEPNTWQAFWRTTIGEEDVTAVAADLGVSKWTVYKAKSRVTQRLREEFADLLDR